MRAGSSGDHLRMENFGLAFPESPITVNGEVGE